MQLFKTALSLALLAGSVLAQSTQITYPPPDSTLTAGDNFTVQINMGGYPENIDNVALVIGLAPCYGGTCYPSSSYVGNILYQGPYTPKLGNYYANYTLTVPTGFPPGKASLNAINFFLVGASFVPIVDYLNENVTVVASNWVS